MQIYAQRVCCACRAVHPFTFKMSNFLFVLTDQLFGNSSKFLAKRKYFKLFLPLINRNTVNSNPSEKNIQMDFFLFTFFLFHSICWKNSWSVNLYFHVCWRNFCLFPLCEWSISYFTPLFWTYYNQLN